MREEPARREDRQTPHQYYIKSSYLSRELTLLAFISFEADGIYSIPISSIPQMEERSFSNSIQADKIYFEERKQFFDQIHLLPIKEQLQLRGGVFVEYLQIQEIKEVNYLIAVDYHVITRDGKTALKVYGFDKEMRESFKHLAHEHGFEIAKGKLF